jgi:UbiD family decarboxylase
MQVDDLIAGSGYAYCQPLLSDCQFRSFCGPMRRKDRRRNWDGIFEGACRFAFGVDSCYKAVMDSPIHNLQDFIDLLRRERQIVAVDAAVDADQEIAEIHRRVAAADGPALLFTNVIGSAFPVATNLFGTMRRAELAFGRRPLAFVEEAARAAHELLPPTAGKLWRARGLIGQALRVGLRRRGGGPVTEAGESPPRLSRLPMLKSWPEDGGAFLTLPLVLTHSPADGAPNLGIYRMQRHDATTLGMHWQIGKGGGFHYWEAEQRGEPLPVTVMLGGPPALTIAAIAPLPEGISELLLASLLLGRRLPMTIDPASGREVVAEAEFALIGEAPPGERRPEGPFGDHYGYYSLKHDYPVFRCRSLLHRRGAVYPATVVGKPRQEDYYIGEWLQRLLRPLFPLAMPAVRDLWSYGETGFHSLAAAVVRERYGREAMMAAFRILGEGQLSLTKFLLATDTPMDLTDFRGVLEHVLARFRPETDLYVFSNLSMDTLDYTGPEVNKGSKGVLLGLGEAVRELPGEWTPTSSNQAPAGAGEVRVFCRGCLVVGGPKYAEDAGFAGRLAKEAAVADWPLVVVCDRPAEAAANATSFLWTTFTRFEPAADLHAASMEVVRKHLVYRGPVVIDARIKPWYPAELFCAPEIAEKVGGRWKEYFPGGGVEMGDSDRGHLR